MLNSKQIESLVDKGQKIRDLDKSKFDSTLKNILELQRLLNEQINLLGQLEKSLLCHRYPMKVKEYNDRELKHVWHTRHLRENLSEFLKKHNENILNNLGD